MSRLLNSFLSVICTTGLFSSNHGSYELDVYETNELKELLKSDSISSSNETIYDSFFYNYKQDVSTILEWNRKILQKFDILIKQSRDNFEMARSLYKIHGSKYYGYICLDLKKLSSNYLNIFHKKNTWENIKKLTKIGSDRVYRSKREKVDKIIEILKIYKNQVNELYSIYQSSKEVCKKNFFPHDYSSYFKCRNALEVFSEEIQPPQDVLVGLNSVEIFLSNIKTKETYSKSKIQRCRIRNN